MKKILFLVCSLVIAVRAAPSFYAPETLKANGVNIDVTWYGSPLIYDWDDNGTKDLVCGQFTAGNVRLYPNSGTNNAPAFTSFSYLQADGVPISVYAS